MPKYREDMTDRDRTDDPAILIVLVDEATLANERANKASLPAYGLISPPDSYASTGSEKQVLFCSMNRESERNWYPATQHDWLARQLHYTKRFLLQLHSPTPTCWFSHCPMGHHPLCPGYATGGIEDYKTNHSLRATSTSRLYQSGVDEQLIMEWSGHRTQFLMSRSMPCSIS